MVRPIVTVALAAFWLGACTAERAAAPPPKAGPSTQPTARAKAKRTQAMSLTRRLLEATQDPDQRAQARGLITRLADSWQREQQATRDAALTPLIARLRAAVESLNQVR